MARVRSARASYFSYCVQFPGRWAGEPLAAGFTIFRTLPLDAARNQADTRPSAVPTLLAYGEYSHATLLPTVRDGLRHAGATDVRTALIPGSGHWPAEEQPAALAAIIDDFAISVRSG